MHLHERPRKRLQHKLSPRERIPFHQPACNLLSPFLKKETAKLSLTRRYPFRKCFQNLFLLRSCVTASLAQSAAYGCILYKKH